MDNGKNHLSLEKREEILEILKTRFQDNMIRHKEIEWDDVKRKLAVNYEKLGILYEMELTGGEPDVIKYHNSAESYYSVRGFRGGVTV